MLSKQFALIFTWAFTLSLLAQAAPSNSSSLADDFRLSKKCTDSLIGMTKRSLGKVSVQETTAPSAPTIWVYDEEHYQVSLLGDVHMASCLVSARIGQQNERGEYYCEAIEATDCHGMRASPDTDLADR
jgi:hypothetical protein